MAFLEGVNKVAGGIFHIVPGFNGGIELGSTSRDERIENGQIVVRKTSFGGVSAVGAIGGFRAMQFRAPGGSMTGGWQGNNYSLGVGGAVFAGFADELIINGELMGSSMTGFVGGGLAGIFTGPGQGGISTPYGAELVMTAQDNGMFIGGSGLFQLGSGDMSSRVDEYGNVMRHMTFTGLSAGASLNLGWNSSSSLSLPSGAGAALYR